MPTDTPKATATELRLGTALKVLPPPILLVIMPPMREPAKLARPIPTRMPSTPPMAEVVPAQ